MLKIDIETTKQGYLTRMTHDCGAVEYRSHRTIEDLQRYFDSWPVLKARSGSDQSRIHPLQAFFVEKNSPEAVARVTHECGGVKYRSYRTIEELQRYFNNASPLSRSRLSPLQRDFVEKNPEAVVRVTYECGRVKYQAYQTIEALQRYVESLSD